MRSYYDCEANVFDLLYVCLVCMYEYPFLGLLFFPFFCLFMNRTGFFRPHIRCPVGGGAKEDFNLVERKEKGCCDGLPGLPCKGPVYTTHYDNRVTQLVDHFDQ